MDVERRRVVIVGGGFGGLEAAKALRGANVDVLLVDRLNYHLFQPLLYQVAMAGLSTGDIASPIRGILANQRNVRVMLGEVTRIDLENRRVEVNDPGGAPPRVERYDWLVLAVGARSSFFGHDAWERDAPGLKSIEDALEVRRRVLLAFERAEKAEDDEERRALLTFAVIGGGPTGVETSGAIAELARYVLAEDFRSVDPRRTRVVLIEAGPRILPSFPEDLAGSAVEQLGELGVDVKTHSRVVEIDERGVDLDVEVVDRVAGAPPGRERERIAARTVLWAAGVRASALTECLDVPRDRQGRLVVAQDCSLPGHPDVFAIGDVARFEEDGRVLPGVSPVAMQQGRYVAALVACEAEGGAPKVRRPFRYVDKGSMATIGRSRAIAWARGIKMTGFIAWLAWIFIHIFYLIGFRNRVSVLLNWFWSYLSYKRGSRLITTTGWRPESGVPLPCAVVPTPPAIVQTTHVLAEAEPGASAPPRA